MDRLSNILVMVVSVRSSHTEERKQAATWEKISLHFLLVCFKHIFFHGIEEKIRKDNVE